MKKVKRPVKKRKKDSKIIFNILMVIISLLIVLFVIRLFSSRHLDDVAPNIACDESLLKKADIFYVIPKFDGINISDNLEWCNYILSFNKTLAMHGVYHTYDEFGYSRDENYIREGEEEFKSCFGFYPARFKAPQVILSSGNRDLLKQMSYKIDSLFGDTFHKVYHCNDQGFYPNWVSDLI